MSYEIHIKQKGRCVRKITGLPSEGAAVAEAQTLASAVSLPKGATLEVKRSTPKRRNPAKRKSVRRYRGHDIRTHKTGAHKYVVEPYGHKFGTLKAAKAWVDGHIKRESPKTNPAPPKRTKRGPAKRNPAKRPGRKTIQKRLTAKRVDWTGMTKTQIKAVHATAKREGDADLARKAASALRRRK